MTVDPVKFGEVDFTSCDREPIHIPGAIQPHGVLLVFDRHDLTILQYAGDTASMLGVATDRILGLSLLDLFFEYDLMAITGRIKEPVSVMAPWIVLGLARFAKA
jgi:chemotaxis family two-component system sensor kinase Cph1